MLAPRWQKIIRDLFEQKGRTFLVVMAIAVGVFTFGGVFTTQELLISEMDLQYRPIEASNVDFSLPSFDQKLVSWISRQENVASAQGRARRVVKLKTASQEYTLSLYAYPDYEKIELNKIEFLKGRWPPEKGEFLLERSSARLANLPLGEEVKIELPNGKEKKLKFTGLVHDVRALPASIFPQLTGYVSLSTLDWLGFTANFNLLEIRTDPGLTELAAIEKTADNWQEDLKRIGFRVNSFEASLPNQHWGRDTSRAFTTVLAGIGSFSLLLSAFLVINTITALLTQQRQQIGTMKAVGATSKQVVRLYLVMVIFFGLLSLLVALPMGMGLAYLSLKAVTNFLNLDILNFHLPRKVFLLQLAASLLVPLIAALFPIVSGTKVTVFQALRQTVFLPRKTASFYGRTLTKIRFLPRPVLLSLRNAFRRRGRLFLTLGALTLAGMLFISVVNVRHSLFLELEEILRLYDYDLIFPLAGSYPLEGLKSRANQVAGVLATEGRTSVSARRIKADGSKGEALNLVGIPPDSDFIRPNLLSGRWLKNDDRRVLVVSHQLMRDDPAFAVGQNVTLEINKRNSDWEIIGDLAIFEHENRFAFAPFDQVGLVGQKPRLVSTLYVRTDQGDAQTQAKIAQEVEDRLKRSGFAVGNSISIETIRQANASQFNFLVAFLISMAILVAVVGGLGLSGTMSLNVLERTREIGIMRAVGASDRSLRQIIFTEGFLVGLISWLLSLPLSIPSSWAFAFAVGKAFMDTPLTFSFAWLGPAFWLVIVLGLSLLASWLPARRAAKMKIREALAYE